MIHRWYRQRIFLGVFAILLLVPLSADAGTSSRMLDKFESDDSQLEQSPPPEMPGGSLQSIIDAAAPGSVVDVPRGIFRESAVIDKPLTLSGTEGTEIRGSDVWSDGWDHRDGYWYHDSAPDFASTGEWCRDSSNGRCNWPNQVFRNGEPLVQVSGLPSPGEFSVTEGNQIVLADDPDGATIEVTTRRVWIITASDNVIIRNFTMRHAADLPAEGALNNGGHSNWTVENNHLLHAHMAVVSIRSGNNLQILNNEIAFGGRLGIHSWQSVDARITGNNVHSNNTEEFEDGWEAGGMKLSHFSHGIVSSNEVHHNDGAGIWCDVGCDDVEVSENRVHNNRRYGILYEISTHGRITANTIWENGWGFPDWGFGGGFVCQNCRDTEVAGNILAWNADGISIISQLRDGYTDVVNNHVQDNLIVLTSDLSQNTYMLAWLEDWPSQLTTPASNNRGANNRYYHATPEAAFLPFTWGQYQRFGIDDLAGFNITPGEENGVLISWDMVQAILAEHEMPLEAQPRP